MGCFKGTTISNIPFLLLMLLLLILLPQMVIVPSQFVYSCYMIRGRIEKMHKIVIHNGEKRNMIEVKEGGQKERKIRMGKGRGGGTKREITMVWGKERRTDSDAR